MAYSKKAREDKIERIKDLDELLSLGKPISFKDYVAHVEPKYRRIERKELPYSKVGPYANQFKQDIKTIRDIINDPSNGIPTDMLITEGCNRYKTYRYKDRFSIMDFLKYKITRENYKKIDDSLDLAKDNLNKEVFEQLKFSFMSRIDFEYGLKDRSVQYEESFKINGGLLLPTIYKNLNKHVLKVEFEVKEIGKIEIHPYLLKQYDNKWYLFGYITDTNNYYARIPLEYVESVEVDEGAKLEPKPANYNDFFLDFIGVHKGKFLGRGKYDPNANKEPIRIRVEDEKTWFNILNKLFHDRYYMLSNIKAYNGHYGELTINIIPNEEFYRRLESSGTGIKIVEPYDVAEILKEMYPLYGYYNLYINKSALKELESILNSSSSN